MAHNIYMNDPKFNLIINKANHKERINSRIESFRRDLLDSGDSMEHVYSILDICYEYMAEYEDMDVYFSAVKVKEAMFYLDNYMRS